MTNLYTLLGIQANLSTAYHPQTDGQTERLNQEVELYLRIFVNHRQNDWADWIAMAEFSYNDKEHSSTGFTPFFMNYGLHPFKGTNIRREVPNESASEFQRRMKDTWEKARTNLQEAADRMKKFYDRKRGESVNYEIGDKVYLEASHINTDRPMKKLDDKRFGPFTITEKVGQSAYRLNLPKTWKKIHDVFNEALLSPYHPPSYPNQRQPAPPPPDIIGDVPEYEVEHIVDSRVRRNRVEYLVKWVGYPREEQTWEPLKNLTNAKDAIADFHRLHPSAPKRVRGVIFDWTIDDDTYTSHHRDDDPTEGVLS
jgi:hypothetical protein